MLAGSNALLGDGVDAVTGLERHLTLFGWVGPDRRNGGDAAFLYLSTPGGPGRGAHRTMPLVAEALGLDSTPNTTTEQPGAGARVEMTSDGRIRLATGDGAVNLECAVDREFVRVANAVGHVVLMVSYLPLPPGVDRMAHVDRSGDSCRSSTGLVPVVA
ncbi:hypothetical protein [Embleya sp. NPDC020630]|uniref:hypothetical protein n=1 Tax=Embleya sp. NPDC020630 TaxID=3363979 RepID=UPI0037B02F2A